MAGLTKPSTSVASVSVDSGSTVSNRSASHATIQFQSYLTKSALVNAGLISNAAAGGYALLDAGGAGVATTNTGTITGNVRVAPTEPANVSTIHNAAGGVLAPYDTLDLGAKGRLRNGGALEVGGTGRIGRTALTGDLIQTASGRLRFDLDAAAGKVDYLRVDGAATLAGGFEYVPTSLLPGRREVLAADGGLTFGDGLVAAGAQVFTYAPSVAGNRLSLDTLADFAAGGSDTADRRSVANHLQRVWDAGGAGFATGFAALASIGQGDSDGYASALDTIAGQQVAAIGYARYLSSQAFAQGTYSCPRFEDASVVRTQAACGWFRVRGSWLERDASGDDPGFSYDAVTTAVGGQAEIADGVFLGGALGWESDRLNDEDDQTSVDGDTFLAALSLKREIGAWTLTGAADLGWGDYDSRRRVTLGATSATASASPGAFNAGLHGRAAYQMPRGDWYLEPALDVDLGFVRLDGYTESGAGDFNLKVDEADALVLTGTPWLKVGRRADLASGAVLDAYVSGGVSLSTGQDFDTTARLASAPAGAGDFTARLDNPSAIARLSAGVEVYATDRVQIRLQYDGSFADDQTTNGGQFRISYFF